MQTSFLDDMFASVEPCLNYFAYNTMLYDAEILKQSARLWELWFILFVGAHTPGQSFCGPAQQIYRSGFACTPGVFYRWVILRRIQPQVRRALFVCGGCPRDKLTIRCCLG